MAGRASDKRRHQVRYYRYKHDRAHRTLKGIDEQVGWQARGQAQPVRQAHRQPPRPSTRNWRPRHARWLAGINGYVTNIADPTHEFVIGAYRQLFQIEKSSRMAKSDLAARSIFHRTKDSIEAHLTIVFAALAISRWIEDTIGWSIRKFVKTRPPLPHHPYPGRRPHHHRRRPTTSRCPHRPRSHPHPSRGALN